MMNIRNIMILVSVFFTCLGSVVTAKNLRSHGQMNKPINLRDIINLYKQTQGEPLSHQGISGGPKPLPIEDSEDPIALLIKDQESPKPLPIEDDDGPKPLPIDEDVIMSRRFWDDLEQVEKYEDLDSLPFHVRVGLRFIRWLQRKGIIH